MLKVVNNKIMINRGNIGTLSVSALDDNKLPYTFKVGDVIRFKIMKENDCNNVIKQKDITVSSESTEIDIDLVAADTTIGPIINDSVNYWYEVKLNPDTAPQTIIGFDDEGPKIFELYPEGKTIE